ncbi:PIN-like domain-containing protein [Pseudoflavitalea rhizosphaerae]|uniref:PIN-like domain-containing protein n=1 Tax=Pseudoflavitalea rhizosphaerae TaxID=1884793 RepID=UPI000F8D1EC4|nr:PIN-like domain-containing protein [Pseudoflavitalea rhizosphaerae]
MKKLLDKWTDEVEKEIWKKAIFVFDSSAILNFYELSDSNRTDVYDNIFSKLKDKLWITNQTEYEFLKNKEKAANKPQELYKEIQEKFLFPKNLKSLVGQIADLKLKTSKESRHPYLDKKIFDEVDNSLDILCKSVEQLEKKINDEIEQRLVDHSKSIINDQLLSYFQVTPGYPFQTLIEIAKVGEFRYRHKIPPGYEDEKKKEEFGIAKFGDLIIWLQTIQLAQKLKCPILLVIDDIKIDWCITDKSDKRKVLGPRIELIKEMKDEGGVDFWAYSSAQFLHKAKEILNLEVDPDALENVKEVSVGEIEKIELAVFNWAKKRFKSDDTFWGKDFHAKDTGADIIQTVDGVSFALYIKTIQTWFLIKDVEAAFNELVNLRDSRTFIFEDNYIVWVAEDRATAHSLKSLGIDKAHGFISYVGYVNFSGEFIEVSTFNPKPEFWDH